ncbi:MAG: M28 family peptidase [Chloroflexota bacterium]|nr:M28 family peptidase [Chloroflexota bacterium]
MKKKRTAFWGGLAAGGVAGYLWYLFKRPVLPACGFDALAHPAWGEDSLRAAIDAARLQADTEALSTIVPRHGGSAREHEARNWVLTRFRESGLEQVHLQRVFYPRWVDEGATLALTSPVGADLPVLAFSGSAATPRAGIQGRVVYVGEGLATDYARFDAKTLRGAVHLVDTSLTPRRIKALNARRHGAVAFIMMHNHPSPSDEPMMAAGTAVVGGRIPALSVSREVGQRLREEPSVVRIHTRSHYELGTTWNVIGELPGTSKDYVVLTAHYDAWFGGASDNAAGVAVMLELARLLCQMRQSEPLPHTIRCISYGSEEEGTYGSIFDVLTHARSIKARCKGVVVPDVVGWPTGPLYVDVRPAGLARLAHALLADVGYQDQTGYQAVVSATRAAYSDHVPYTFLRVPAIQFCTPHPYYHTTYDTAERLDWNNLRWTAALAGSALWRLAHLSK